jgi:hypothetical protein
VKGCKKLENRDALTLNPDIMDEDMEDMEPPREIRITIAPLKDQQSNRQEDSVTSCSEKLEYNLKRFSHEPEIPAENQGKIADADSEPMDLCREDAPSPPEAPLPTVETMPGSPTPIKAEYAISSPPCPLEKSISCDTRSTYSEETDWGEDDTPSPQSLDLYNLSKPGNMSSSQEKKKLIEPIMSPIKQKLIDSIMKEFWILLSGESVLVEYVPILPFLQVATSLTIMQPERQESSVCGT